jgi:hypothetical protein|tara:strand:- start:7615 stop:8805 length:1191 start_codon:yes stop_codon:yes gene_type:complete
MSFKTIDNFSALVSQAAAKDSDIDFNQFARIAFSSLNQGAQDAMNYQITRERERKNDERYNDQQALQERKLQIEEDTLIINGFESLLKNSARGDIDFDFSQLNVKSDVGRTTVQNMQQIYEDDKAALGNINNMFMELENMPDLDDKKKQLMIIQQGLSGMNTNNQQVKALSEKYKNTLQLTLDSEMKNYLVDNADVFGRAFGLSGANTEILMQQLAQAPTAEAAQKIFDQTIKRAGEKDISQAEIDADMAKNLSQILKGLDDIDNSYLLDKTDPQTGRKIPIAYDSAGNPQYLSSVASDVMRQNILNMIVKKDQDPTQYNDDQVKSLVEQGGFASRYKRTNFKGEDGIIYQDKATGTYRFAGFRRDGSVNPADSLTIDDITIYGQIPGQDVILGSS